MVGGVICRETSRFKRPEKENTRTWAGARLREKNRLQILSGREHVAKNEVKKRRRSVPGGERKGKERVFERVGGRGKLYAQQLGSTVLRINFRQIKEAADTG